MDTLDGFNSTGTGTAAEPPAASAQNLSQRVLNRSRLRVNLDNLRQKRTRSEQSDDTDDYEEPALETPVGVNPALWQMIKSIKQDTAGIIDIVCDMDDRVLILEDQADNMGNDIAKLRAQYNEIVLSNKVLSGRLYRAESQLNMQYAEIVDLKSRSMRDNVIVKTKGETYKEHNDENSAAVFRKFIASEMRVPNAERMMITRAHRMGTAYGDSNRMLIAKVNFDHDQRVIFANASALKNTDYSIHKQLPIEIEERRQFAWKDYKRARQLKKPSRFDGGRLIVDGTVVDKYNPVVLPVASSLISGNVMRPIVTGVGSVVVDGDHEFQAWVAKVNELQDIRNALDSILKLDIASAVDYIPYAYRLGTGNGTHMANFDSNHDGNSGLVLLRKLQSMKLDNTAVFLTHKGKAPLSYRSKSECITKAIESAVEILTRNPTDITKVWYFYLYRCIHIWCNNHILSYCIWFWFGVDMLSCRFGRPVVEMGRS